MFKRFKRCGSFWFHCWHFDRTDYHYKVQVSECKEGMEMVVDLSHCCRCQKVQAKLPCGGP